jgi:predicted alpha/beta-fold hydrolase
MLESRWFYRNLYSKALGANILHLLRSHLDALAKMPPSKATPYITRLLGMRTPTLKDVDEHATRFVGGGPPMFPCSSADDYYRKASSHFYLPHIRIPFLAINTEDDPIVAENPIAEVKQSKWVALAVTKHGGHLGWFEGGWFGGLWSGPPPRWVNKPVIEWLRASAEELGKEFDARGAGTWEKDGYVLEDGREDVGYRVISENMKVLAPSRAGQWTKTESKLVFTD